MASVYVCDASQDSECGCASISRADVCGYVVFRCRLCCELVLARWRAREGDEDRADARVHARFLHECGYVHAAR